MSVSESSLNQNNDMKDAEGFGCTEVFILGDNVQLVVFTMNHTTLFTLHNWFEASTMQIYVWVDLK